MPKTKGLTLKQRRFQKELIKTLSPTEAAMRAYNCKDRLSARNIASENLAKLGISMADLMDKMGLTNEEDVRDLMRLRKAQKVIGYLHQYKKDEDGKIEKIEPDEVVSNEFVTVDDNQVQLKALELTAKLKGNIKDKPPIDQSTHYHIFYENIVKKAGLNGLPERRSNTSSPKGATEPN